jgi:flagellar P-ring protein precursor FlgI
MRRVLASLIALGLLAAGNAVSAETAPGGTRLKDIAALQGPSATAVLGYGLVVGLNKTGDRKQTIFSAQTLASMLERFGVAVSPNAMKVENIAAVVVTAEIGPYTQNGGRIDVVASSIGDARSLQGGTLLPTPLRGPDGAVVALAQGPLSIGGFGAGGGGNSVAVNHLTVGRVPRGAQVQAFHPVSLAGLESLSLALYEPDFASAARVAAAINMELGADAAHALDAGSVQVRVPAPYKGNLAELIARLEPLTVNIDAAARVVINERTGTVVMGGDVRLGAAAVAHGNLSVRISTRLEVSQPAPLGQGDTTVVPQTRLDVDEGNNKLIALDAGTTLTDVVKALNGLGATPRDIIAIMQALKAAGALRAELVIL